MIKEIEAIMRHFGPPSFPGGFVKAKRVDEIYNQPALNVRIGDRDITIMEDGAVAGVGSRVGDNAEWIITKRQAATPPNGSGEEHYY